MLVLTSLWDVQTLSVGGLSVRLPFIWKPSVRSRWKDIGVDNDGGDADGG